MSIEQSSPIQSTGRDQKITERGYFDRKERHDKFLDSITEQSLDEFDERDIDLVLVENDFYKENDYPKDSDYRLPRNRSRDYICMGDIDLAVVDLDTKTLGIYEVKPNPDEEENGVQILERFKGIFEDDYSDWSVTGHVIQERHLNKGHLYPDSYDEGMYCRREDLQDIREDEGFQELREVFRNIDEEVFTEW